MPAAALTFDLVVVDCPDALLLAQFYAEILGWQIEPGATAAFATLAPPGGGVAPGTTVAPETAETAGRTSLAFQRIEDWVEPTWPGGAHPQQLHLDFWVSDLDAAEPALVASGARVHPHQPSENGTFRVYLDPVGHPFCLITG